MDRWFVNLARFGALLALVVVTVGAWVRLTDAGLGCPDWPGCYGRLVVPESPPDALGAAALAADEGGRAFDATKARNEMIHRYLASALGLVCVVLAGLAWRRRREPGQPVRAPLALLALVVFQGLLGMWTVTLLLKPIVVVLHLLGGMATLALLFWLGRFRTRALWSNGAIRALGIAALAVLIVQIALGGWTSANYAALACPDFPTCQMQWWPEIADFDEGFVLWRGIGIDYEGGVLDHPARVAVHFAHRLGAILAAVAVALFGLRLWRLPDARADAAVMLSFLAAQLALGVSIVWLGVPLAVAVAHNGVAALLLLSLINAHKRIWQN